MRSLIKDKVFLALKQINFLKNKIIKYITRQTEESGRQIISFGVILTINYPLYYIIWLYASYQSYENLILRLSASCLCFFLIIKNYWPRKFKKWLPLYWYFTVIYSLPFFFTFMTLKNNGSAMWLMNCVSVLFFLLLLFDVISVIVLLILGIGSGFILYLCTTYSTFALIPGNIDISGMIATFGAAFIIGAIFAHNREKIQKEKLQTMQTLAVDIAHELRTPLATINATAMGTKEYLPDLIKGYEFAKEANLPINPIRASQLESLYTAMDDISTETHSSNNFINMLLTNVGQQNVNKTAFYLCSITTCINKALERYPFQTGEKDLIRWDSGCDFNFLGDELLTIHILFNLLKNAIYYIKVAHKGDIHIWLALDKNYNRLHFRDSGKGIPANILPKIFDMFFSKTYHGSGIGLAFCKTVMQSYDGKIECKSIEGEFTEFILSFPKLKS